MRILVPYPSSFDDISNTSILFKKLIPEIEKKSKVTILWVNYQPEKLEKLPKSDNFTTLDLHNYQNAVDLIKQEKPDLIFAPPHEGCAPRQTRHDRHPGRAPRLNRECVHQSWQTGFPCHHSAEKKTVYSLPRDQKSAARSV